MARIKTVDDIREILGEEAFNTAVMMKPMTNEIIKLGNKSIQISRGILPWDYSAREV